MDFQIVGEESLRIKGKKVSLAVDPKEKISKFDAEAILSTDKKSDSSRINDYRVMVEGPGEYEVSGLKISAMDAQGGIVYELITDNSSILIARASDIAKLSAEKLDEYKIVVINADAELNQSMITAMEPSIVILYGNLKKEGARKLGSEASSVSGKISVSEDKFPDELEVMLLG